MKSMIIASLFLTSMAFANDPAHTETAAPAPAHTETAAPAKTTVKQAKAACKSEGKKGKELKACIKSKTM